MQRWLNTGYTRKRQSTEPLPNPTHFLHAGVPGDYLSCWQVLHACSSVVGRPKMLGVLVGVDLKDSFLRDREPRSSPTVAVGRSWLVLLMLMHFVLCSSVVVRLKMLGIMPGMDQKDSSLFSWPRSSPTFGSGMCLAGFAGDGTFHAVFTSVWYEPEGQVCSDAVHWQVVDVPVAVHVWCWVWDSASN